MAHLGPYSLMKSGVFHGWKPANFMAVESGGFHGEILWILHMKSSGFHVKSSRFYADLEKCKLENVKFLKHL